MEKTMKKPKHISDKPVYKDYIKGGKIEFLQETRVSASEIVALVQSNPHQFRLTSANQLSFKDNMEDREKRFTQIEKLLDRLSKQQISD